MTAIGPIIWGLAQRFRTSGAVKDRPRSDRPKRLTPREERYIRITADRDRFLSATRIVDRVRRATGVRISAPAVHNKLQAVLSIQENHIKVWS
jgi:transposase